MQPERRREQLSGLPTKHTVRLGHLRVSRRPRLHSTLLNERLSGASYAAQVASAAGAARIGRRGRNEIEIHSESGLFEVGVRVDEIRGKRG